MVQQTVYKPDYVYSVFLRDQQQAIRKNNTDDPSVIADAMGIGLRSYMNLCREVEERLKM